MKKSKSKKIVFILLSLDFDSEAFLFTTKKVIENSKKVSQKLRGMDGF